METHRHLRPEEMGGYLDGRVERHSDPLALTQLLIAYQVVQAGLERGLLFGASAAARRVRRSEPRRSGPGSLLMHLVVAAIRAGHWRRSIRDTCCARAGR